MTVKLDPVASLTLAAQPTDTSEAPPLEPPDYLYAGRAAALTLLPDWWAPDLRGAPAQEG